MASVVHIQPDRSFPACQYLHDVEFACRADIQKGRMIHFLPLKMQILLPAGSPHNGPHPLVVFVNGGGYHNPKMYIRVPWLSRLAERGYVVAMPQYRGSEDATFPAMVQDVRTAIRFLRTHAKEYGIDPEKVVLMGGSAGGHTALLAAYAGSKFDAPDDDLSVSASVCGVLDLYGAVDVMQMEPMVSDTATELKAACSPAGRLFGMVDLRKHPEMAADSIVTRYIHPDKPLPPTFIAHGDADSIVPYQQSELLYNALHAAGQDVEFYCVDGAEHADPAFFHSNMMDLYSAFIQRVIQ